MGNPTEAKDEQNSQKRLIDVSDQIVFAQFFTGAGLLLALPLYVGAPNWVWYLIAALALMVSLVGAIQWWRLTRRKKELLRRGIKEPDYGKPAELEGIERLLRD